MKKLFILLAVTLSSMQILASTYAGYCGPVGNRQSLTWFLDTETGVLTFRGSGEVLSLPASDNWNEYGAYISTINMPAQIKVLEDYVFSNCTSITTITLPSNLTTIGKYVFDGCTSLRTIQIPNTVTKIDRYAFQNCSSLTSITIPNKVSTIKYGTFVGCRSLTSVALPISITEIEDYAFSECKSLKNIRIPINCAKIGHCAFQKCSALTGSFFIPLSVREIGESAFWGCTSITKFYYPFGLSVSEIGLNKQNVNFQVYMDIPDEFADYYESSDSEDNEDNNVYSVPEVLPLFPGGPQAMTRFLVDNIHYPAVAAENGIQGKAVCSFIISKDGSVTDVEVVRSAGDPSLDREAVRLIKSMPKWTPGTIKGKPVRVKLSAPVNFRLN